MSESPASPPHLIGGKIAGHVDIALFQHQALGGGFGDMLEDYPAHGRGAAPVSGLPL